MGYIEQPIDVVQFDRRFRLTRGMAAGTVLVRFTQTERRWSATYQDEDTSFEFTGTSFEFTGSVAHLKELLKKRRKGHEL